MQMFMLHFWCPHTCFFKFIFDIVQLVVTSADNNSGFIFLIKLNEPVGTGDQIRMKPGALSHQWQKKPTKKTEDLFFLLVSLNIRENNHSIEKHFLILISM